MPVAVKWYIPLRVVDARFWGDVTVPDTDEFVRQTVALLTEAQTQAPQQVVKLLLDTSEAHHMPPIYKMMPSALPVLRFKNRGLALHITRNNAIRRLVELSAHVSQYQLMAFSTREEALQMLEKILLEDDAKHDG